MQTLMRVAVVVAMLAAARASWAGGPTTRACCFANGSCQVLSDPDCTTAGGVAPGAPTCSDPGPCVGCCVSGNPETCEDHVTFVDCRTRPNLVQYGSPAVCGTEEGCVTIATFTATQTATVTSTPTNTPVPQGGDCTSPAQCATPFCVDGVCCDTACTDPGQVCNQAGNQGVCTVPSAPAPTLTPLALLFALVVLGGLAGIALRRRRSGPAS